MSPCPTYSVCDGSICGLPYCRTCRKKIDSTRGRGSKSLFLVAELNEVFNAKATDAVRTSPLCRCVYAFTQMMAWYSEVALSWICGIWRQTSRLSGKCTLSVLLIFPIVLMGNRSWILTVNLVKTGWVLLSTALMTLAVGVSTESSGMLMWHGKDIYLS